MRIKKYFVKRIDDALSIIKKDLGKDAYIVSTKKVKRRGNLNIGEYEEFEVTAAVDSPSSDKETISNQLLYKKYGIKRDNYNDNPAEIKRDSINMNEYFNGYKDIKEELIPLKKEIEELKNVIRYVNNDDSFNLMEFKGIYRQLYYDLVESDVDERIAKKLINSLRLSGIDTNSNNDILRKKLFNLLVSMISNPSPINSKSNKKVILLIGPTGTGKTTTIAKLASYYKLMEMKDIAILTIDNFRIGSESQISTYARIIDVPFYSIYTKSDMRIRINNLMDKDMIFIDTIGRSANDINGLNSMREMLSVIPDDIKDVFLVLSSTTKKRDLYKIFKNYSIFKPNKFIFTKVDETYSLGNAFSLKVKADLPVAYFTTGQRVPEDIEIAYPRRFARMVLELNNREVNYESSRNLV